ncbi:class I SAM-dependent methyltransferase [Burkholderiaceae bacterium]|nr:class I SAM-dependent methyltransferase [Burkholderiaceae bacterium]
MIECTYGLQKRLDFVANVISTTNPVRVLDVGCGTGTNLTERLAQQFPRSHFIGIDSDATSIAFANRQRLAVNAQYLVEAAGDELGLFDLVIASEVIEHVEDPLAFLAFLRGRLTPTGHVVLTLPNGYGPYELVSLVETLMHLSGIYWILRAMKRMVVQKPATSAVRDTLAISPHINFFSYSAVRSMMEASGFQIAQFLPRTFLCGFGFDHVIRSKRVIAWNAKVSDYLPAQCASAWMFVLSPTQISAPFTFTRGYGARLRRYLNEKRWKLR